MRALDVDAGQAELARSGKVVIAVGGYVPPATIERNPQAGGHRVPDIGVGLVGTQVLGTKPMAQTETELGLHLLAMMAIAVGGGDAGRDGLQAAQSVDGVGKQGPRADALADAIGAKLIHPEHADQAAGSNLAVGTK